MIPETKMIAGVFIAWSQAGISKGTRCVPGSTNIWTNSQPRNSPRAHSARPAMTPTASARERNSSTLSAMRAWASFFSTPVTKSPSDVNSHLYSG
jgi:hypothetical protein